MAYLVTITKVMEGWWGLEELRESFDGSPEGIATFNKYAVEMLKEDIGAVVEDAAWAILEIPSKENAKDNNSS